LAAADFVLGLTERRDYQIKERVKEREGPEETPREVVEQSKENAGLNGAADQSNS
jgi:hypothetical protein